MRNSSTTITLQACEITLIKPRYRVGRLTNLGLDGQATMVACAVFSDQGSFLCIFRLTRLRVFLLRNHHELEAAYTGDDPEPFQTGFTQTLLGLSRIALTTQRETLPAVDQSEVASQPDQQYSAC